MAEKVFSLNFASVVATFTPKKSGIQPVVLKADVFWTDEPANTILFGG